MKCLGFIGKHVLQAMNMGKPMYVVQCTLTNGKHLGGPMWGGLKHYRAFQEQCGARLSTV